MIYVIIPAFNEAENISSTIKSLKKVSVIDEITVVDDGSSDDTAKIASEAGAAVYRCSQNYGKGRAIKEYLKNSSFLNNLSDENIIVFVDADTGKTASEIEKLIEAVRNGADCAVAKFPPARRKGGFGLVKWLARTVIKKNCGFLPAAPLSGQRAIRGIVLKKILPALDFGFGLEVAMTLLICKNGFQYKEVPVSMSHRETGRNLRDFLHRGKQFIDILRVAVEIND